MAMPRYPFMADNQWRLASLAITIEGEGLGGREKLAMTIPPIVVWAGGDPEAGVVVTKMLGLELEGVGCDLGGFPVAGAGGVT